MTKSGPRRILAKSRARRSEKYGTTYAPIGTFVGARRSKVGTATKGSGASVTCEAVDEKGFLVADDSEGSMK